MLCFFCTLAAFTHSRERVNRKAVTNKTLVERARNIEKLEKTTKLSLSSSFRISMWIAIHSFMFHYNLMSGRFYGAGPARVAHWSFGEDLVSSEKKLLFSMHTFFSLQHRSGRGDIMRQAIAQAKATICQCPAGKHRAQVKSGGFSGDWRGRGTAGSPSLPIPTLPFQWAGLYWYMLIHPLPN